MPVSNNQIIGAVLLAGVGYYLYTQGTGDSSDTTVDSGNSPGIGTQIMAAVSGYKNVNDGPIWVPVLNAAEAQFNLPADILCATAFQESSFLTNVINGTQPSSDGLSLGIMQLQTAYYPSVNVAVPFSQADVEQQIQDAAQTFATNYAALGSWPETIAAFNQGLNGVQTNGITSTSYVAKILANCPAANV